MMNSRVAVAIFCCFLLLLVVPVSAESSNSICMLCEQGVDGIKWRFHVVDPIGTTCLQQAINMASLFQQDTPECDAQIDQFRDMCCGDHELDPIPQAPTAAPVYNGPIGHNEVCDICWSGDYPGNTAMVITMLYIGSGSCKQFYQAGQAGLIPNHLCDSLQYFAYEPCGCGEFNKNKGTPSPPKPHPSPPKQEPPVSPPPTKPTKTYVPIATPVPTPKPTPMKPPSPTPRGTPKPTLRPRTRPPTAVSTPPHTKIPPATTPLTKQDLQTKNKDRKKRMAKGRMALVRRGGREKGDNQYL